MTIQLMPTPAQRRPRPHFRRKESLPIGQDVNRGLQVFTFQVGDEMYAFRTKQVVTTLNLGMTGGRTWRVINSHFPFFRHFFAYADDLIPLVDLRHLWNIPHDVYHLETPIIVVQLTEIVVGFFVDGIGKEALIALSALQPLPTALFGYESVYFHAMYESEGSIIAVCNEQALLNQRQQEYLRLAQGKLLARQREKQGHAV